MYYLQYRLYVAVNSFESFVNHRDLLNPTINKIILQISMNLNYYWWKKNTKLSVFQVPIACARQFSEFHFPASSDSPP